MAVGQNTKKPVANRQRKVFLMHIPDGYLSPSTCLTLGAAMVPVWAVAAKKVKVRVQSRQVPLMAMGAAFSFVIMMYNIPLPGGTSGHAVGGALLAVVLGPWAACICVSVALVIQALLFGDGGGLGAGGQLPEHGRHPALHGVRATGWSPGTAT